VYGNYMKPSLRNAGLDPDNLPESDNMSMDFGSGERKRRWKDIWGAGQGVGQIDAVMPVAQIVQQLISEYASARARLMS
jgi:nitronate monooxygenase